MGREMMFELSDDLYLIEGIAAEELFDVADLASDIGGDAFRAARAKVYVLHQGDWLELKSEEASGVLIRAARCQIKERSTA
jgi:hypothetical protein